MGLNLGSIFSGGASELIKSIGGVVDNLTTTKAEKEQLNIDLQKLVTAHEEKMTELANAELQTYLVDNQSARDSYTRIEESDKASWMSKNILPILAVVITIGFFGLLAYMFKYTVPKENERILDIMLGSLSTAWISVVGFFFGSSLSSHNKDKTISNSLVK